jgi:hypothetical protein
MLHIDAPLPTAKPRLIAPRFELFENVLHAYVSQMFALHHKEVVKEIEPNNRVFAKLIAN